MGMICKCAGETECGCIVVPGDGIAIAGVGSPSNPYTISASLLSTKIESASTSAIQFELTGDGSPSAPFVLTAHLTGSLNLLNMIAEDPVLTDTVILPESWSGVGQTMFWWQTAEYVPIPDAYASSNQSTAFPVAANAVYEVEMGLWVETAPANPVLFRILGPTGTAGRIGCVETGTSYAWSGTSVITGDVLTSGYYHGLITIGGTPGTLTLQPRYTGTSDGFTMTRFGTHIRLMRVA